MSPKDWDRGLLFADYWRYIEIDAGFGLHE